MIFNFQQAGEPERLNEPAPPLQLQADQFTHPFADHPPQPRRMNLHFHQRNMGAQAALDGFAFGSFIGHLVVAKPFVLPHLVRRDGVDIAERYLHLPGFSRRTGFAVGEALLGFVEAEIVHPGLGTQPPEDAGGQARGAK